MIGLCATCGTEFRAAPSSRQRFCSKRCARIAQAEPIRKHRDERPCELCGNAYQPTTDTQRFCGRRCANAHTSRISREKRGDGRRGTGTGYVKRLGRHEHRVVAEQTLGRPLTADEVVHHVNGDQGDNRPENLQVMTRAAHSRLHIEQSNPRRRSA